VQRIVVGRGHRVAPEGPQVCISWYMPTIYTGLVRLLLLAFKYAGAWAPTQHRRRTTSGGHVWHHRQTDYRQWLGGDRNSGPKADVFRNSAGADTLLRATCA